MRYFTVILLIVSVLLANAQQVNFNKETFRFYTSKGKVSTYESLYNACLESDIILFGELHNNAVVHWLQLELAQDLLADSSHKLILGAEMIERHQQLAIEEYVQGVSDYKQLKSDIKLWNNFKTDYKPLVDLAKTNHLDFVGTNCPRVLAKQVARRGLDSLYRSLSDSTRSLVYPQLFEVDYKAPGYKELMEMDFGSGHGVDTKKMVQAQALKDATMAWFILESLKQTDASNTRLLHFNGDFHSKNNGGIAWFLKEWAKKKKVLVISSIESSNLDFDKAWKGQGNFILVTPENFTKTY